MHETSTSTTLSLTEVVAIIERPLLDLVHEAANVHRRHHDARRIQVSQLLSVKTGACSEDCGYCAQSAHHGATVEREPLLEVDAVLDAARAARAAGADRFCMGAAWRKVRDGKEFERVLEMVRGVKALGLATCVTLGMLNVEQASQLSEAGLDYYNHNLDTGRSHYPSIVSTHTYEDRLETIRIVRAAGIAVCCGGILGLGEDRRVRAELLFELSQLDPPPDTVPINVLVPIEGTPLEDAQPLDWTELVRAIAVARLLMPDAVIRLSAGRENLSEEAQALCFLAGAGSIFLGERLLTTTNAPPSRDLDLLGRLGLEPVEVDGKR